MINGMSGAGYRPLSANIEKYTYFHHSKSSQPVCFLRFTCFDASFNKNSSNKI